MPARLLRHTPRPRAALTSKRANSIPEGPLAIALRRQTAAFPDLARVKLPKGQSRTEKPPQRRRVFFCFCFCVMLLMGLLNRFLKPVT